MPSAEQGQLLSGEVGAGPPLHRGEPAGHLLRASPSWRLCGAGRVLAFHAHCGIQRGRLAWSALSGRALAWGRASARGDAAR